ncbi:C-type lectin domain family 17, member A-like, partial [Hyalella azteca]|uniref:C-type lectin domain family 17, member A-like n=1 Tax=Hyalella azteca TaxID=294128 RepID=A0A8B7P8I8_HYAAZ
AVAADCPEGYEVVGSKCIHRYTGGYLTYDEAATYCYQNFGRLPVLKDCASFTDVANYVNDGYTTDFNNGYWLGATNGTLTNVWQWSDGAAVQMGAPYWARNAGENLETEPAGGTGQNCAYVERSSGWLFRDNSCPSTFYPFCSRPSVDGELLFCFEALEGNLDSKVERSSSGPQEPDNPGKQNCLELNCAWMYRFSSAWCSDVRRVICEADPI